LFLGAAIRTYHDADGHPGREVIARCRKGEVAAIEQHNRRLPWLAVHIRGGFRVPQSASPWVGNPNLDHTFALRRVFHPNGADTNFQHQLAIVRNRIEATAATVASMEAAGNPSVAGYRTMLAGLERDAADLMQRLSLEALIRSIDDGCDGW
jgi:hypothetical protein